MSESQDWDCRPVSITDGDTIRAHLSRNITLVPGWATTLRSTDPKGKPLRIVILDTPEKGQPGWAEAKADAERWITDHLGRLRCRTYESGGWDRLLADVYVDGDRNDTLLSYMLLKGWPPYVSPEARGTLRG